MAGATITIEELTEAWWNGSDVREARARSGYEENGDLAGVMEALLAIVDERESTAVHMPDYPPSTVFKQVAQDYASGRPFGVEALPAITQLLDLGAEPERLKGVFPHHLVDRAVSTWRPWREAALTAARSGACPEDVRVAVTAATKGTGNAQAWGEIVGMLNAHGFDQYTVADAPATFPDKALTRHRVMELYAAGVPRAEIAAETGVALTNVHQIISRVRSGRYAELQSFLEKSA